MKNKDYIVFKGKSLDDCDNDFFAKCEGAGMPYATIHSSNRAWPSIELDLISVSARNDKSKYLPFEADMKEFIENGIQVGDIHPRGWSIGVSCQFKARKEVSDKYTRMAIDIFKRHFQG